MAYKAKLFTPIAPTKVSSPGGLSKFLKPAVGNSYAVDVVNKYRWTLTPQRGDQRGRSETPFARLTEFRLLDTALVNASRYYAVGLQQTTSTGPISNFSWGRSFSGGLSWLNSLFYGTNTTPSQNSYSRTGDVSAPYAGLFDFGNPTGFWYDFPYFNETNIDISNSWTSLDIADKILNGVGNISSIGRDVLEGALKTAGFVYSANYPRVGVVDRPKLWESSTPRTINIRFPLFNTYDTNDIIQNWELCYLLTYQNLFNKRDFVTSVPPVFYTVYIPGQYFTIAAYVSNLQIRNRGNMRFINIGGKLRNIPDVYEIDITLTDMILPSQNMHSVLLNETPIRVQDINRAAPSTTFNTSPGTTPYGTFPRGSNNPSPFTPSFIPDSSPTPSGGPLVISPFPAD